MGDVALAQSLRAQGIRDGRVLSAVAALERRRFVPSRSADLAQADHPLPIGYGQTISQPYVVAFMTEALQLTGRERVLEIGTGSGYQTAVLAQLCEHVYSLEIVPELAQRAADTVACLGFDNISLRQGNGFAGWPEAAPFDAILVTAAPTEIPTRLVEQLEMGGRLIAPVGAQGSRQELMLLERSAADGQSHVKSLLPVQFVPMTGEEAPEVR